MHNMDMEDPRKMHAHSFRVTAYIRGGSNHMQYNTCEQAVQTYLDKYEGIRINDLPAFKNEVPTLENMCIKFYGDLCEIVKEHGAELIRLELGDSPVASFSIANELLVGTVYNAVAEDDFKAYEAYLTQNYHLGRGKHCEKSGDLCGARRNMDLSAERF